MSAQRMDLDSWLQELVQEGALSLAQAWAFQDHLLVTPQQEGELVMLPRALWPAAQMAFLVQAPALNLLPL